MILEEFVKKYDGQPIDYDGAYGYQCMDEYRQYNNEVLKFPQSAKVKGAKDIWTTYLPDYFDRISYTPGNVPVKGDIVIWGSGLSEYGHVAIFIDGDAKSFISFDQNWPEGHKCGLVKHDYKHVLGWLHPKQQPSAVVSELLKAEGIDTEGELREVLGHHKDYPVISGDLANANKEINQLKEQMRTKDAVMDELNKDINAIKVQNSELRQQHEDFLTKLIKKLNPLNPGNDEATVLGEIDRLVSTEDDCDGTKKKLEAAHKQIDELKLKLEQKQTVVNYKDLPSLMEIIKLLLLKSARR